MLAADDECIRMYNARPRSKVPKIVVCIAKYYV